MQNLSFCDQRLPLSAMPSWFVRVAACLRMPFLCKTNGHCLRASRLVSLSTHGRTLWVLPALGYCEFCCWKRGGRFLRITSGTLFGASLSTPRQAHGARKLRCEHACQVCCRPFGSCTQSWGLPPAPPAA